MKNKFFTILASLALATGASSCVDLDTAPLDQKSETTMWAEFSDAEQAVSYLYNYLPDAMYDNDEDIYTDNAVYGIKWAPGNRAHGVWSPSDFGWGNEYGYIRVANLVLTNLERVPDLSESQRNSIVGQARFFRAMIYSDLIRMFGDVPYIDQPLLLSDQKDIVRTDWKEVYDHAMADYDAAIAMLPEFTTDGRANKQVARGFKAKIALYFANPACPHSVSDGYQTVINEAGAIIASGHYSLWDEGYTGDARNYTGRYAEQFWGLNAVTSPETLIGTSHVASFGHGSDFIGFEAFPTLGWGGLNPTQGLVDAFEDCEGAPIAKSKVYDVYKPNLNRDPRLGVNVIFSGDEMYGVTVLTAPMPSSGERALYPYADACGDATLTGYHAKKWLDPAVHPQIDGWNHDASSASMRFTEVLLMYAEAMNETSPLSPAAFDAVNRVRARVGMPALQNSDPSLPTYCATQDDLRQRIRNEFRVEFCFEGNHRQWDARRWNIATDVLNADRYPFRWKIVDDPVNALPEDDGQVCILYAPDGQQPAITDQILRYQSHNYLYPIPQTEVDLSEGRIVQNPGYLNNIK